MGPTVSTRDAEDIARPDTISLSTGGPGPFARPDGTIGMPELIRAALRC